MTLKLLKKKEKENNREYAYRLLRSNIMTLHLPPGTILNEGELADILEISRTPVHEAIIKLKSEYLVEVYPQSGSKVSLIDLEILKEGLFLRSTVEPVILKTIAGHINSDGLKPLKQNLESQLNALELEDPIDTFFKLDDEFHHIMYNIANKPKTWYSIKSVSSHYDRVRYIDAIISKTDLKDLYNQHKNIYHLILMGITNDSELDQFYNRHLGTFQKNFERLVEQYSHYFVN
jgi:GntR family transcriptional regulator, rspAB operon transcriptional repressor